MSLPTLCGASAFAAAGSLTAKLLASPESDGDALALRAQKAGLGYRSERVRFELLLLDAQGAKTERKLTFEIIEDGTRELSRIGFEWPAAVRGTTLITHSNQAGEDEQWLYLPAVKRSRRISSGHRTGSFMGSEFSYEDLTSPVVTKFRHTRLADQKLGDSECHVLERRSKDAASGYSKQVIWLETGRLIPHQVEFYDRKGELLNVATYAGYAAYGNYFRAREIRMENKQTKKVSLLTAIARSLGEALDTSRFQEQSLGG
jgi:hypothetical protein